MKRLAVITTSLVLTLAAFGGSSAAIAEESKTNYPQNEDFIKILAFTDLKDYDIEDGAYYFLDGENYYKYQDGELTRDKREEFTPAQSEVSIGDYIFRLKDSTLKVGDFDGEEFKTFEGKYSTLKQFGNRAYAVKNNVLYSFDGTKTPEEISLKYSDYSVADKLSVGQTAAALTDYGALTFVTAKKGAFMTEIDLTKLDGEYFVSGATKTVEKDTTALVLCYTGNAAVIAFGDAEDGSCYLILNSPSAIEETQVDCRKEAEFANATISGNRIYASPFTVIGTTLLPNATGTIVNVKCKIECPGVLNSVYYEVEYAAADGKLKTGYVAYGHLTEYIIEDNKEPSTVEDPEHSEKNNVTSVLLILAVVVLVLIAVGYVVYTVTSGKKKGKNRAESPDKKDAEKAKER